MKIYLERAIFVNRAPFDQLELDFNENEISVLSAVNGRGKTTILSHIVDAFYEMARPYFLNFENKKDKFYRISSSTYNLDQLQPSFVYLRFKSAGENIDYVDIRNKCTEEEYNSSIKIEDKIAFNLFKSTLENNNYIKYTSSTFNKDKAEKIFLNNVLTYFPSYRYEIPGYINEPYKMKLNFRKEDHFTGDLNNNIEVISGLPQLANWIMDIVLDIKLEFTEQALLWSNLNTIISQTLISKKYNNPRFGVGSREFGSTRIQIVENPTKKMIYPSIFNLSSGESAILCLFGELLRQADNNKNNINLTEISGIVLIDEVEKHLHIKLQKEVLPKLFQLFPNVQFIVSSHSPFLSMGLAEEAKERSKIIDLDNLGISKDPKNNELYKEVYSMMLEENGRFKELYESLKTEIQQGTKPLIITEGKTDIKHLKKAKEKLDIQDCDIDFQELPEDYCGDSNLKALLEHLSKIPRTRKIIGVFDRDVKSIINDIERDNQSYKKYGNNVYAFCIPVPTVRENYTNISIEFYYTDQELKKEKDGKCLYFDNEVEPCRYVRSKKTEIVKLSQIDTEKEFEKKIFCQDIGNENWIHSKTRFAELIEDDATFTSDFDFSNFEIIFNKIKEIIV